MTNDIKEIYTSLTGDLISGAFKELIEWFSVFKGLKKSEIPSDDANFLQCVNMFQNLVKIHIAKFIPYFEFEEHHGENDSILCGLKSFDALSGVAEYSLENKITVEGIRTSQIIARTIAQSYWATLAEPLKNALIELFYLTEDFTKEMELYSSSIFYVIHTSVILTQVLSNICLKLDYQFFNTTILSDRITLQMRHMTFLNNVMNSSKLPIQITVDDKDYPVEGEFHASVSSKPNFELYLEQLILIEKGVANV